MNKISRILLMLIGILTLAGCTAAEKNIRGVPVSLWQQLTGEQKQLIIDRAYEDEFGKK